MSNLAKKSDRDLITFSRDQIDLIKSTVAKGATDDELAIFLHQCQKTGLDPLARQIYFRKQRTKNGDQMTIITGIDGYRAVADRTGLCAGNDDPVFDDEEKPMKATVTVYKIVAGVRCPYTATARWNQYYPGDSQGFMWRKMPHLMLGKCAEALALRKAFPVQLSGIYTQEEMEQADTPPSEMKVAKPLAQVEEPHHKTDLEMMKGDEETYTGTPEQIAKLEPFFKALHFRDDERDAVHKLMLNQKMEKESIKRVCLTVNEARSK